MAIILAITFIACHPNSAVCSGNFALAGKLVPRWVLMAVEIRVFLAVDAFCQKPGTTLAFARMLSLSPAATSS